MPILRVTLRAATLEFGHDRRSACSAASDERWCVDRNPAIHHQQSLERDSFKKRSAEGSNCGAAPSRTDLHILATRNLTPCDRVRRFGAKPCDRVRRFGAKPRGHVRRFGAKARGCVQTFKVIQWAIKDSNLRPHACDACALTN